MILKIILQDYKRFLLLSKKDPNIELNLILLFSLLFSIRMALIIVYRLSAYFFKLRIYPLASLLSALNRFLFGLEISRFCLIKPGLCIPHPIGVIIGANEIGANCTIFQGVTIGSKEIDFPVTKSLRPNIGDDVVIGSGAKILGGINIANKTIIGANAVIIKDINKPGFKYVGVPAKKLEI